MSSIMTNSSAMTALKSLQATNSALDSTQSRISTGYRVNEASDNAAYWSIATTMRSDNKALSTVQDALGLGAAKIDVAYTGMNAAIDVVDEMKSKLVAASEPGVDRSKIQTEFAALQKQLTSIANSSSFSGENWLSVDSSVSGYSETKDLVSSFNRTSAGSVSVETIEIDTAALHLFDSATGSTGLLDGFNIDIPAGPSGTPAATTTSVMTYALFDPDTSSYSAPENIPAVIDGLDSILQDMTTLASDLGASKSRVTMQTEFVGNLMDAIDRGIGALVDADMTKESTRLSALQTQQQLGTQALSIANSSSQSILSLFR